MVEFKKFKATIEYKVEMTEYYEPTVKREQTNLVLMLKGDPEVTSPKVTVEEVE